LKTEELLVYENPFYIKLTCFEQSDYIIKVTLKEKMKDILAKYAELKKFELNKLFLYYNEDLFSYDEISDKSVNDIASKTDKKDRVFCGQIFIIDENSLDSIDKTLNIDEEIIKKNKNKNKDKKKYSLPSSSSLIDKELSLNMYDICLKKWIDYSSKYGLAYTLSDGHVGLYFNDSTKIIYKPNGTKFIYIEGSSVKNTEKISTHLLTEEFSKDLDKKVNLFKHFKAELLKENKNIEIETKESENIDEKEYIFINKWFRTGHAFVFRLSNKSVHVIFFDKSEIFLNYINNTVKYLDKNGQLYLYPLDTALESNNHGLTKRVNYFKETWKNIFEQESEKNKDKIEDE